MGTASPSQGRKVQFACNKESNKWNCMNCIDVLIDSLFHHFTSFPWQTQSLFVHYIAPGPSWCDKDPESYTSVQMVRWNCIIWKGDWNNWLVRPVHSPIMWNMKIYIELHDWLYGWNEDLIHWFGIWIQLAFSSSDLDFSCCMQWCVIVISFIDWHTQFSRINWQLLFSMSG